MDLRHTGNYSVWYFFNKIYVWKNKFNLIFISSIQQNYKTLRKYQFNMFSQTKNILLLKKLE